MSVHKVETHPQLLSTNRHIMQGYMDMPGLPRWDSTNFILSGRSDVVADETCKIVLATNGYTAVKAEATVGAASIKVVPGAVGMMVLSIDLPVNSAAAWKVKFAK